MGDGVEGFGGPGVVPVDGAAVDDGGELAAAVTELLAYGGEGEDDVEVFTAELDEITKNLVSILSNLGLSSLSCQLIADLCLFLRWEQIGHFSTIQQIIDVFQERFPHDLSIREKENLRFTLNSRFK